MNSGIVGHCDYAEFPERHPLVMPQGSSSINLRRGNDSADDRHRHDRSARAGHRGNPHWFSDSRHRIRLGKKMAGVCQAATQYTGDRGKKVASER